MDEDRDEHRARRRASTSARGQRRAGDAVAGALMFGAIGTGLALGFDALIRGDVVIYRASPVTINLAADPARRRALLVVRVRVHDASR